MAPRFLALARENRAAFASLASARPTTRAFKISASSTTSTWKLRRTHPSRPAAYPSRRDGYAYCQRLPTCGVGTLGGEVNAAARACLTISPCGESSDSRVRWITVSERDV